MTRTISLGLVSILVAIAGCGSSTPGTGNDAGSGSPGMDLATHRSTDMALHGPGGTASFAQDVKPILTSNGCFAHHMTTTWNPVEALTANADIVNFLTSTKTEECMAGGLTYVKASDSANSFLYQKLTGNFASACGNSTGSQMPLGGTPLQDFEKMTVKLWIDQGAANN